MGLLVFYQWTFLNEIFVSKSDIGIEKSQRYWDEKNVFVDDVKLSYYDGDQMPST